MQQLWALIAFTSLVLVGCERGGFNREDSDGDCVSSSLERLPISASIFHRNVKILTGYEQEDYKVEKVCFIDNRYLVFLGLEFKTHGGFGHPLISVGLDGEAFLVPSE